MSSNADEEMDYCLTCKFLKESRERVKLNFLSEKIVTYDIICEKYPKDDTYGKWIRDVDLNICSLFQPKRGHKRRSENHIVHDLLLEKLSI